MLSLVEGKTLEEKPKSRVESYLKALCGKSLGGGSGDSSGGGSDNAITDFSYFCYEDSRLDMLEHLDTTAGVKFKKMFGGLKSDLTIPKINTSNGVDFSYMFDGSIKLTSIPELNTSNGSIFRSMFSMCQAITSIPKIDTSKAETLVDMFSNCIKLTSVPELNTSNCTDFTRMFNGCSALTSVPELDTSKGGLNGFSYMFNGCSALTSVPELDTSNNGNFTSMFGNCKNLKSIRKIDMRKAYNANVMFQNCSSLTDLYLYNIKLGMTIGSGTSYGHLLTVDSLVHIICELIHCGSARTLSMGATNLEKIANLYCRIIDDTTEKLDMELCESTDEGAMTLVEYAALKKWTLA